VLSDIFASVGGSPPYKLSCVDHFTAEESCREAIRLRPDHAEAYNNLGNSLQGQGKSDAAIEQYQQAIRLKPDSTAASRI
jgi:Flp pilus assembly protein TadD